MGREHAILDEQGTRVPTANDGEPMPGVTHSHRAQCINRGCHEFQAVARRQFQPARNSEHAAGRRVLKVFADRLHGIDVTLTLRMHTGTGRAEGIEQADVNQVILASALCDETARLTGVHGYAWILINKACEARVCFTNEFIHSRIELYRIDAIRAVIQRQQHVAAAAGAENQDVRFFEQRIGQGSSDIAQVAHRVQVAIEACKCRHAIGVCKHGKLLWRDMLSVETQARRMANRYCRALDDGEQPQRTRRYIQYPAVDHLQRLAKPLVFRDTQRKLLLRNATDQQYEPDKLYGHQRHARGGPCAHDDRRDER